MQHVSHAVYHRFALDWTDTQRNLRFTRWCASRGCICALSSQAVPSTPRQDVTTLIIPFFLTGGTASLAEAVPSLWYFQQFLILRPQFYLIDLPFGAGTARLSRHLASVTTQHTHRVRHVGPCHRLHRLSRRRLPNRLTAPGSRQHCPFQSASLS